MLSLYTLQTWSSEVKADRLAIRAQLFKHRQLYDVASRGFASSSSTYQIKCANIFGEKNRRNFAKAFHMFSARKAEFLRKYI